MAGAKREGGEGRKAGKRKRDGSPNPLSPPPPFFPSSLSPTPFDAYIEAIFSKSKTLSYDTHFLEQTGIEQILDTRGACHQAGNPEKSGWKVIVKVIFSEIPTKHLGLRFEVVQSFRSVWTRQNVAYHLSFPAV